MGVFLHWDHAADLGSVNVIEMRYKSGNDNYHVRNLRVVIDGGSPLYGEYPVGSPYTVSTASGTAPGQSANLGQAYDGGGPAAQWSNATSAYVSGADKAVWYFPWRAYATSVWLYWDDCPDLGFAPLTDTSTADIWVNTTDVGDFTTGPASGTWVSRSLNITAWWNGGSQATDTSTADVYLNGVDLGDFTTPQAKDGWASISHNVTSQWKLGQTNKVEVRYKAGNDTYHVRSLRAIIDSGAANYGHFPLGYEFTAASSLGYSSHLGQGQDGSGTASQISAQTGLYVHGGTYLTWHFPAGWLINAVGI